MAENVFLLQLCFYIMVPSSISDATARNREELT